MGSSTRCTEISLWGFRSYDISVHHRRRYFIYIYGAMQQLTSFRIHMWSISSVIVVVPNTWFLKSIFLEDGRIDRVNSHGGIALVRFFSNFEDKKVEFVSSSSCFKLKGKEGAVHSYAKSSLLWQMTIVHAQHICEARKTAWGLTLILYSPHKTTPELNSCFHNFRVFITSWQQWQKCVEGNLPLCWFFFRWFPHQIRFDVCRLVWGHTAYYQSLVARAKLQQHS